MPLLQADHVSGAELAYSAPVYVYPCQTMKTALLQVRCMSMSLEMGKDFTSQGCWIKAAYQSVVLEFAVHTVFVWSGKSD